MRRIYRRILILGCIISIFLSAPALFAQVGMTVNSYFETEYHRFYVADLGLVGGASSRTLFTVRFGSALLNTTNHYLHIEVKNSGGDILLSGDTDTWPYNERFSGKTYTNSNLSDDNSLGGDFELKGDAPDLKDKVLATGAFPSGAFEITIQLVEDPSTVVDAETIIIRIVPPYLQPIFPVSISVSEASLNFRWRSNLHQLEFHLYEDPRGQREVVVGSRLPQRLGQSQSLDGAGIARLLNNGKNYFWQIKGYLTTSHGREPVKGPLSEFLYLDDISSLIEMGLTEEDKITIKEQLDAILLQLLGKRGVKSLANYKLERVVFDNISVSRDEIMAILSLIKGDQVEVKTIDIR